MIFERLGYNPLFVADFLIDDDSAKIQSIKDQIFQISTKATIETTKGGITKEEVDTILEKLNYEKAEVLIRQMEDDGEFMSNLLTKQYVLGQKAMFATIRRGSPAVRLNLLLDAIKVTIPNYNEVDIKSYFLTRAEIMILGNLSITYWQDNNSDKAISILYGLKENYDTRHMDISFKGKEYPNLAYNLARNLAVVGNYKEAIKICDDGKAVCLQSGHMSELPHIILIKAIALCELGDTESGEKYMRQAYYSSEMLDNFEARNSIREEARGYGITI